METIFYLHAGAALIFMSLAMFTAHVVHALLFAVMSLLCLAVSMYSLSAHIAAAFEVIVYAGAIMILFVFAIMLLKIPASVEKPVFRRRDIFFALVAFGVFWADLVFVLSNNVLIEGAPHPQSLTDLAHALIDTYGFSIEVISFVLLGGLVTAIFLSRGYLHHKRPVEVVRHDPT